MNIAVLMGRLTADPELRTTPSGISVTSFTLAVRRAYSKQGAENSTDFIDIVAWRQTAEFVCKYFHKGQLVAVDGSIQTRSYQDKNGNNRKAFEIVANNVHFAEAKRDSYSANTQNYRDNAAPAPAEEPTSFSNGVPSDFEEVIADDDLPF